METGAAKEIKLQTQAEKLRSGPRTGISSQALFDKKLRSVGCVSGRFLLGFGEKCSRGRSVWNPIFGLLGLKQEDESGCTPARKNLKVIALTFIQLNRAKLLLTTVNHLNKRVVQNCFFTYMEGSLVGVNWVSKRSLQKKKMKKEKCTTWEDRRHR